jgi:hypothetical protein
MGNPKDSSMGSGAGMIWGPSKYGDPGALPEAPKDRKLEEFQAFDRSPMANQMISGLRTSGSQQKLNAARSASKMGMGQSDSALAQQGRIGSDTANKEAAIRYQSALDTWNDRMSQKQFAENMDLQKYKAAQDAWNNRQALYEGEKQKRRTGVGLLGPIGYLGAGLTD